MIHETTIAPYAAVERQADGSYLVRGYDEAKRLMLSNVTQAGFTAEETLSTDMEFSRILLMIDGEEHNDRRKQVARFFTPKTISDRYAPMMNEAVDRVISKFEREREADLCDITAELATYIVTQIVGLDHNKPGLTRRLQKMLVNEPVGKPSLNPIEFYKWAKVTSGVMWLHMVDVMPAIRERRKTPGHDMISHMLSQGRSSMGILAETMMYGIAGIATTQEFLIVCVRMILQHPELRDIMLHGEREERQLVLLEIPRLYPVVAKLFRRAQEDITVGTGENAVTVPKGSLIVFNTRAINRDPRAFGANADEFELHREKRGDIPWSALAFGAGIHRCAGEFLAIEESDFFLQKFLKLDIEAVRLPDEKFNPVTNTYSFRNFLIRLKG